MLPECRREPAVSQHLDCPLVVWLPDYALTRLAQESPDFWAWRSGVFEFAPEPEVTESALRQMPPSQTLASEARCWYT